MTPDFVFLLFALVVVSGYLIQTATGFGSTLVCVTLGSQLISIEEVVHLVVPISFLQTGYIVVRHHRGIAWALLRRRVLPLMGAGMAIAFLVVAYVEGPWLGLAFGCLVLALATRDLRRLLSSRVVLDKPISRPASTAALLGAGVVHGIYASGGPMLVYAIGREGLTKTAFRSTLSVVWILLNTILVARFVLGGVYGPQELRDVSFLVPAVPIGIVVGEWLHHRVDERRFRVAVLALLVAAALSLIVRYGAQLA